MLRLTAAPTFGLWSSLLVSASTWGSGLPLADQPAPTSPLLASNKLHPSISWGSAPVNKTITSSPRRLRSKPHFDQFDFRQSQCADPGDILVCPITEKLPCCRPDFPVCCQGLSDTCCPSGTFCQGVETCCPTGSIGCGEGCCDGGTTCCGSLCCLSGWTCQNGACTNTQLSTQPVQVRSLVAVASVTLDSVLRESSASASRASASLSSKLAGQNHGDANPDTINTVLVLPSDPRIEYDSSTSWVDTTQSGIGSCTNGTRVAKVAGSSFTFAFSGSSVGIQTAANAGPVNYTVIIDGKSAVASDRTQALNQCHIVTSFIQAGLSDAPHSLKVVLGSNLAGKMEFSGIIYTGRGAFGTQSGGGDNRAAVIGGAVGGTFGFLLLVVLGFCIGVRHQHKRELKKKQLKQPPMQQQQGSSRGAPPYTGSYESFPGTAGHEQPHSSGREPVPPSAGYNQTSPRRPAPIVPPEQKTQASPGDPSRGDPHLVQPAVPLSAQPGAISPAPRRLSTAAPLPMWVELARSSAASPTVESSNNEPDSAPIQGQPRSDASGGATRSRPRPRSIHDPRYYTAADFYGLSPLTQGPSHPNDS